MKHLLLATAMAIGLGGVANAATVTWDMSNGVASPGAAVGTTTNITACGGCGITISAAGFSNAAQTTAVLFEKNLGGNEIGLGLTNDPTGDDEISGTSNIVVNFKNAIAAGATAMSFDFKMDSTTSPDAWAVLTSSTGLPGSFVGLTSGSDEIARTGLPLANFYEFEATAGNVLISQVSATIPSGVPEPQTWALMLLGFVGLGFAFRTRRKSVSYA
jgi:PEP-CTERM motif